MPVKLTQDQWVGKANQVHQGAYDYSDSVYINGSVKIRIRCRSCNLVFEQLAASHLQKVGCPSCARQRTIKSRKYSAEKWIGVAVEVHGDKFDYSNVIYIDSKTKVEIKCSTCKKSFTQSPDSHLGGCGCPHCANKLKGAYLTIPKEQWIADCTRTHNGKYDYSLVEYVNNSHYVTIICKDCNDVFTQKAGKHYSGRGCRKCAGNKPVSTQEWVSKARAKHGDEYDYDGVRYDGANKKVTIRCKKCNLIFSQSAGSHLSGCGCPRCGRERLTVKLKSTTDKWIAKAKEKHPGLYDYSEVVYIDSHKDVSIRCLKCGKTFNQRPTNHLSGKGKGCPACARRNVGDANRLSQEEWIARVSAKHPGKYDYSLVEYRTNGKKVKIKCLACNSIFEQAPSAHDQGHGCPKCAAKAGGDANRLSQEEWIAKASKRHPGKYDYSLVNYVAGWGKVKIKCLKCNTVFEQCASSHIQGSGCPKCVESQGELMIAGLLTALGVNYVRQKKFSDCRNKHALPFDFYLPDLNICIEYNGEQHYRPVKYFRGEAGFEHIKRNDKIKATYCKKNGIRLAIIHYRMTDAQVKSTILSLTHVQFSLF